MSNGKPPSLIQFRRTAAKGIPSRIGVYALCDLDDVPVYVGQSRDGIRQRVNRHITSARSDVIANRQVDVWEIASVQCWLVDLEAQLEPLEAYLFHQFNENSPLMNGTVPPKPKKAPAVPDCLTVCILPREEIESRRRTPLRLARQAAHFAALLDHYLIVKNSPELLLALGAHFARLQKSFSQLGADPESSD